MFKRGFLLLFALAPFVTAAGPAIQLSVDASDMARRILHAKETIPVSAGTVRVGLSEVDSGGACAYGSGDRCGRVEDHGWRKDA